MTGKRPRIHRSERAPFQKHPNPKIRLLAYQLNSAGPDILCPPKNRQSAKFSHNRALPAMTQLDSPLCALPLEILYAFLGYLSLHDLVSLRQTQQHINLRILAYPPYRDVRTHVPLLLEALFMTRLAKSCTAEQALDSLRADRCCKCLQIGAYVFLPMLERCCFECLKSEVRFRLLTTSAAQEQFSLPLETVRALPTILTYPGRYGFNESKIWRRRRWFVSAWQAMEAAAQLNLSTVDLVIEHAYNAYAHREGPLRRSARDTARALGLDVSGDPYSGVAAIRLPFLRGDLTIEEPMWCAGCERYFAEHRLGQAQQSIHSTVGIMGRRAYTEAGLLAHILECSNARFLWDEFEAALLADAHRNATGQRTGWLIQSLRAARNQTP